MKKGIIFVGCILLNSCALPKAIQSPYITVYASDRVGNIPSSYIILRKQPQVFELHSPVISESIFGQWKTCNDTLYLTPRHEFYTVNSDYQLSELTQRDTSVATIPMVYLIKTDCLTEITDYNMVLPEPFNNKNTTVFNRVY